METGAIRIILGLVIAVSCMVIWPRIVKINAFFSLLFSSLLFAGIVGIPFAEVIPTMQSGFGSLLQQIGIIIALGSVLGTLLEKSGAMEVISSSVLRMFGKGKAVLAISVIGALVGIPVFCDSGFIILSRMIPSLAVKTSARSGALVLALSSGLYTTHVLVPPTPGPLAAAASLGLAEHLGTVMIISLLASIPVVLVSYLYAFKTGMKIQSAPVESTSSPLREMHWAKAALPLILPVILIAAGSFAKMLQENALTRLLSLLGIPVIALLIGVVLALALVDRKANQDWAGWITDALKEAGIIILITGAGGAFGALIKASGVERLITNYSDGTAITGIYFLIFAWLVAAVIKTAQGSSTSSMIITSALLAPLAAAAGFTSVPELSVLVIAMGGGAFSVSHANDSYFWVVSQFGGLPSKAAFSFYTPMTLIMGITALVTAILLSLVW